MKVQVKTVHQIFIKLWKLWQACSSHATFPEYLESCGVIITNEPKNNWHNEFFVFDSEEDYFLFLMRWL